MGLAAAKNRQKLSRDPNNTAWARDTTGFGHKILLSQGWKPGGYLGAADAKHSSHFTAASASHIKVTLKDDTLGIGARRTAETAETFGLGSLADIYGRLSGKETVQQQEEKQKIRADLGRKIYSERRYGQSIFVSGGFLVGDKIQGHSQANVKSLAAEKVEEEASTTTASDESDIKKGDKKTKRKALASESAESAAQPRSKKHKKDRKVRSGEIIKEIAESSSEAKDTTKAEKRKRKQERQERRERKAAKRAAKSAAGAQSSPVSSASMSDSKNSQNAESAEKSHKPLAAFQGSRQAVRRRFIQSKRMAMNPEALREILMAKT